METIWKINLKITLTLLFLIVSISIAFAAAPVLNSVVGGAQEPDPLDSSLVGYWDMDDLADGNTINDRTLNNNDGTIVGANRSYGKLGWGMEFDGNQSSIDISDDSSLDLTTALTIEAWVKTDDTRVGNLGDGSDENITVNSMNTIVNNYTFIVNKTIPAGTSVIGVNDTTEFSVGDEILVIQMQNSTDGGKAGTYEFADIRSIDDGNITLWGSLKKDYYSGTFDETESNATQIVRVPHFSNVTIHSGASITALAWKGWKGGIIIFRSEGLINISGAVNATEKGFRGGISGSSGPEYYGGIWTQGGDDGNPGIDNTQGGDGGGTTAGGAGGSSGGGANGNTNGHTASGGGGAGGYGNLPGGDGYEAGGGGGGRSSGQDQGMAGGGGAPYWFNKTDAITTTDSFSTIGLGAGSPAGGGGGGGGGHTGGGEGTGGEKDGTGGIKGSGGGAAQDGFVGGNGTAGGGIIMIFGKTINASVTEPIITADGGVGGSGGMGGSGSDNGGGGGAGAGAQGAAGGSIWLVAETIVLDSNATVRGGTGGNSTSGGRGHPSIAPGGNGGEGGTWVSGGDKGTAGTGAPDQSYYGGGGGGGGGGNSGYGGKIRLDVTSLEGTTDPASGYNDTFNVIYILKKSSAYGLRYSDKTVTAFLNGTSGSAPLSADWHQVVMNYDGSAMNLYVDGALANSASYSPGIPTNADSVEIGNYFEGAIDEVKIWNKVLTADEIAKKYSRGLGTGNITTQNPLAVSVNESSDGDGDTLFTAVDWWKGTELNATTGKPDDNGVVLFMPFDGSTNDYSGYSYDGTATNGAKFTNNSAMGLGAMSFDGVNDYVDTTNAFDETLPKTISLWANKRSQTGPYDGILRLESYLDISSMGGDELMVMYDVSNVEATGVWGKITSSDPLPLDEWTMITLSLADTSNLDLYINGEYLSTMTYIPGSNDGAGTNTDMLRIGAKGAGATHPYFDGLIDEVRIYNRALSPSEISQLYYGRSKGGLVLNQSQTKKDEKWNATVTLYDDGGSVSSAMNFSFGTITSCGYLAAEGDWNIDGEDGCTLDRNYDLGNNDVTIDGEGIFNLNGFNLTNINKITMRGISATQRLIVRCIQGSCFKQ
jgi:hypothetical protein